MKIISYAFMFSVAVLLTSCGKEVGGVEEGTESLNSASTLGDESLAAVPKEKFAPVVLLAGYQPSFPVRLRSSREQVDKDGRNLSIAVVEYYELDTDAVVDTLVSDLKARGLVVKDPVTHDKVIRVVAQHSKVGVITADVSKGSSLDIPEDAKGTIYFSWFSLD